MAEPASDRLHIQRALIMLNLQRAQVFGTMIEGGNDASDEAVHLWIDAAIDAVNTRQSVGTPQLSTVRQTLTRSTGIGCFPRPERIDAQMSCAAGTSRATWWVLLVESSARSCANSMRSAAGPSTDSCLASRRNADFSRAHHVDQSRPRQSPKCGGHHRAGSNSVSWAIQRKACCG
jgi:hypothetical protein